MVDWPQWMLSLALWFLPRPGHWSSLSVSGPPIAWNITSSEQRQNWFKWASVFLNILGEAGCLICDCCPVVSICSSLRPVCSLKVNEQALTLKKAAKHNDGLHISCSEFQCILILILCLLLEARRGEVGYLVSSFCRLLSVINTLRYFVL